MKVESLGDEAVQTAPESPEEPKKEAVPESANQRVEVLKARLLTCVAQKKLPLQIADQIIEKHGTPLEIANLLKYVDHYESSLTMEEEEKFSKIRSGDVESVSNDDGLIPRKIVGEEDNKDEEVDSQLEYKKFLAAIIHRPYAVQGPTDRFQEIFLPSSNIFYGSQTVLGRKLNFENMRKLARVAKTPDPKLTVESIRDCLSIDIQTLTFGDFVYFLYWLRSVSLPKSPITLNWQSRYGTSEKMTVNMSKFKETRIDVTEELLEELEYYDNLGLTFPRVYDMTSTMSYDIDPEDPEVEQWVLEQVQYFKPLPGERVGARIKRFSETMDNDLSLLDELSVFKDKFNHGVEEIVKVQVDPKKFNPKEAIVHLRTEAEMLVKISEQEGFDAEAYKKADEYRKEAEEIEQKIEKGEGVIPRSEQLNVRIDLQSFFSGI